MGRNAGVSYYYTIRYSTIHYFRSVESVTIPIFPLPIVAFEEEEIRLHIFEPRYKKLVSQSVAMHTGFGIPTLFNNNILSGGFVQVNEISNTYPNGDMDIICHVHSRFRIVELLPAHNPDDHSHAIVETLEYFPDEDKELNLRIVDMLHEFYGLSRLQTLPSFLNDFAFLHCVHKCGLGLEKELEMGALPKMSDRQLYVINHLKKAVALLFEIRKMNELIKLNGHYKKISSEF